MFEGVCASRFVINAVTPVGSSASGRLFSFRSRHSLNSMYSMSWEARSNVTDRSRGVVVCSFKRTVRSGGCLFGQEVLVTREYKSTRDEKVAVQWRIKTNPQAQVLRRFAMLRSTCIQQENEPERLVSKNERIYSTVAESY